jgi:non-ribosomal peptide synthase protein (TIGR01720 family)
VDLSRTIGFFTASFPVAVEVTRDGQLDDVVRTVAAHLASVPNRGLGYGLLRWLGPPAVRAALAAEAPPPIVFNYLGQHREPPADAPFRPVLEPVGPHIAADVVREELLTVTPHIVDGSLRVGWTYSTEIHDRATVERLAARYVEHLRVLGRDAETPDVGGEPPAIAGDARRG